MFYPFFRTTALILFATFCFEATSIAGRSGKKEEQQEKAKERVNKRFQKIRSLSQAESDEDQKQKERNEALFQLFEKSSHVFPQLSLHDLNADQ
ncbi:MAG: hypothetical protein AB8G05_21825 [Oligoflexales bacterium]